MAKYQFEVNHYKKINEEPSSHHKGVVTQNKPFDLLCLDLKELPLYPLETEIKTNIVLGFESANHESYALYFADYLLFCLTLKKPNEFSHNEKLIVIKKGEQALLFYEGNERREEDYLTLIHHSFSQIETFDDPSLLIPYALCRQDIQADRNELHKLENEISEVELSLDKELANPQTTILTLRKKLSSYKHHYLSLIDLLEELTEDYSKLLTPSIQQEYDRLLNKLTRLNQYTSHLLEYIAQVYDRYRSEIDLKLNRTMSIFTIISAIFLPLTLIVGWYGMNFPNMPEIDAKHGYLYVIILSLTVLILSLYYIKKRGFWD